MQLLENISMHTGFMNEDIEEREYPANIKIITQDLDLFNFSTNCTRICSKDNNVFSRNFSYTDISSEIE